MESVDAPLAAPEGTNSRSQQSGLESVMLPEFESVERRNHRNLLEDIFWEFRLERNGNDEAVLDTVLNILRASPLLSMTRFKHRPYSSMSSVPVNPRFSSHSGFQLLPITYLLIGGAPLEVLTEIMAMGRFKRHRNVYVDLEDEMPDGLRYPLLHTACLHRSHETELIRHIATLARAHLNYGTEAISLPIHIALNKYAPVETIQVLLDLEARVLTMKDPHTGMDCLQRALWQQSPADQSMVDLFVTRLLASTKEQFVFRNEQLRFTQQSSEALLRLSPCFESFLCYPGSWQGDAWIHFLTNLTEQRVPQLFALNLPWDLPTEDCGPACQALAKFLGTPTNLQTLILANIFKNSTTDNTAQLTEAIVQGLSRKGSVTSMQLVDFRLSGETQLANLFMVPCTLREVTFMLANFSSSWNPPTIEESHSSIEVLRIRSGTSTPKYMKGLLLVLSKMPMLKKLYLQIAVGAWDVLIEPLAHLIRQNRLELLNVYPYSTMDVTLLSQALMENTNLQELAITEYEVENSHTLTDVLEHHNSTLKTVYVENESEMAKIQYWAVLNQYGRGEVRKGNATLRAFVDFIINTGGAAISQQLNLLYGLLRECPDIWCKVRSVSEVRREGQKRKRV